MNRRLERIREDAVMGGVAAGIAQYFNIDRSIVRFLFVVGFFLPHFPSLIIYLILWVALPERVYGSYTAYESQTSTNFYTFMNPNERNGNVAGGLILVALGGLFLLDRWFGIHFRDMWPLILIGLGVWLIVKDRNRNNGPHDPYNDRTNPNDPYNGGTTNNPHQPL